MVFNMKTLLILMAVYLHYASGSLFCYAKGVTAKIALDPYHAPNKYGHLVGPLNISIICITVKSVISVQGSDANIQCSSNQSNILVTVKDVQKKNAGTYRWGDGSKGNMKKEAFTLFVTDIPTTPNITSQRVALLNKPFNLQCLSSSTTAPEGHNLTMTYEWTRNTKPLKENNHIHFTGSSLIIDRFTWKQEVAFRCRASENGTGSVESSPLRITAERGPTDSVLYPNLTSIHKVKGEALNITCSADCRPKCTTTWKRGNQIGLLTNTKNLYIDFLKPENQDTYTCAIENSRGEDELKVNVSVEYGPATVSLQHVKYPPQNTMVPQGSSFTGQCKADCRPTCTFTWMKDGSANVSGAVLSFNNVMRNQSGTYTCLVENKHDHQKKEFRLVVSYPAAVTSLIVNTGASTKFAQGSNVSFTCNIDSVTPANITWKKTSKTLQSREILSKMLIPKDDSMGVKRHTYSDVLELPNIQCRDLGEYTCAAENELGNSLKNITVNVNCAPSPTSVVSTDEYYIHVDESRTLLFNITANPEPEVLTFMHVPVNGTISSVKKVIEEDIEHTSGPFYKLKVIYQDIKEAGAGQYSLTLTNSKGNYQLNYTLVVQAPPCQPTNVTVASVSESSITLSFIPGFDGHAQQYFEVRYTQQYFEAGHSHGGHVVSLTSDCANSSCRAKVTNLTSGMRYNLQLRAVNEAGRSEYTERIKAETEVETVVAPGITDKFKRIIIVVLIGVGVIVFSIMLAGLIYLVTCRPCRRKRVKFTNKVETAPESEDTEEEVQQDLWESVAADQSMIVPYTETSVERRVGEYRVSKMRIESVTMTTFTEEEPEPRYVNFRWDSDKETQPRYTRYISDADTADFPL